MALDNLKKVITEEFTEDIDFIVESIKKLDLNKKSKILDVGTGFGIMAIILALDGFDVLTGEPEEDPEKHQYEKHHHERQKGHHGSFDYKWRESAKVVGVAHKITFQHFNAENLPFSAESFDAIFLYDALQHIKKKKIALEECIRVMRPDGMVCIIETNEEGIQHYQDSAGFTIDYINPKMLLDQDDISIEIIKGKFVNMYILKKI